MKLILPSFWLLCIALLALNIPASGQRKDTIVNLVMNNATYGQVFDRISKQTGLQFSYSDRVHPDEAIQGAIALGNVTLRQALYLLIKKKKKLDFEIIGSIIYIDKKPPLPVATPPAEKGNLVDISGLVTDSTGTPLPGATVRVITGSIIKGVTTDPEGQFYLKDIAKSAKINISYTGFQSVVADIPPSLYVDVKLQGAGFGMGEVEIISTGYQTLPRERATGSFATINTELLNRRVSTNVIDRIEGVASGIFFNKAGNRTMGGNDPLISIRGRSTLFAETAPLIVLDNFPYEGDIKNINPNDIASISVLKDAAAASIWGARAGNGVIVIMTKKGAIRQPIKVSFNSNATITEKPDLFYTPQLTSAETLDLEKWLFSKGAYNSIVRSASRPISTGVATLNDLKLGRITAAEADAIFNKLQVTDIRDALKDNFYRTSITQQHFVSVSGGSANQSYYLSVGYDKNNSNTINDSYERLTVNATNTHYFLNNKLSVTPGILLTKSLTTMTTSTYTPRSPYDVIADDNGNPVSISSTNYRKSFLDTAGAGYLLDWSYKPLEERQYRSKKSVSDYKLNLSIKYAISENLDITASYQYGRGYSNMFNPNPVGSFYSRNLINSFTQVDRETGTVKRPIPLGDINQRADVFYKSNYGRIQANYFKNFNGDHYLSALAGFEIKDSYNENNSYTVYGVDKNKGSVGYVDYVNAYPDYVSGMAQKIPGSPDLKSKVDRFLSYFLNASYTYREKYMLSGSVRRDESNLFGVSTNKKGVPLWSVGASWEISKEQFYQSSFVPFLKLRITNGYNGNIDRSISAFTTARYITLNDFGAPYSEIQNPVNPNLRWEKVHIQNIGLDFALKRSVISGSIEYFNKRGSDLLAKTTMAPQSGVFVFKGNYAEILTKGVDITLNANIVNSGFKWNAVLLTSFVKDKVVKYDLKQPSNFNYISTNYNDPMEGKPYSAIFAYKWAGLDNTGDPQGYLSGKVTKDWSALRSSNNPDDMVYIGPASPAIFGSFRNTFSYQRLVFSFNIIYKFKYFYRLSALNSSNLVSSTGVGYKQINYSKRWQKPGDEMSTNVPAVKYPSDPNRDDLYQYADVNVEKGDHIRLQDIQLAYNFGKNILRNKLKALQVYLYVNNLSILWRANKNGIDPDVLTAIPPSRTYALGIKLDL